MTAECVAALSDALRARGECLATAESCTGGLIAATCTELAGSSDWFERGFVSYSNVAKTELLGVPAALISEYGAVSEPVARAMARGAIARSRAQWAVAVTGIAGQMVAETIAGQAERFDLFTKLRHHDFPGGPALRTPALMLAMLWFRLKDLLNAIRALLDTHTEED